MHQSKKVFSPGVLMAISMVLLIVLQALWLRTEFQSARDSFSRETNMAFRTSLHQMSDSIFFGNIQDIASDSIIEAGRKKWHSSAREGIRRITITHHREDDSLSPHLDSTGTTNKTIAVSFSNPENPDDSIVITREISDSRQDMRWLFTGEMQGYNTDSIAIYYRRFLNPPLSELPFAVLEKEFAFSHSRQPRRTSSDSLPYTTSWYPFAKKLYAVEFQNAQFFVIRKLIPQAGFALFTTALIFISFLLVYRSMRAQQKLMEQKDHFVGNITHELKTPVASVGVAIEAMKNFDVLTNRKRAMEYLDLAQNELNRLSILTDKILKTSVLEYSDEIRNNKTEIDLGEVVEKVLASFRLNAEEKNIELLVEKTGRLEMKGNEEHISQAIYNLVDNAMKYASEGKYIKIILGEQPENIILEIEDKGPGIKPEHKNRIFDKFYRIPTGNVHNVKGYGLGLHYVRGVVKHHGGKISLESGPGKGCKFIVKLPRNYK